MQAGGQNYNKTQLGKKKSHTINDKYCCGLCAQKRFHGQLMLLCSEGLYYEWQSTFFQRLLQLYSGGSSVHLPYK